MINWIIGIGAAAVVIASIVAGVRRMKRGESGCGCDCGCSGCNSEQCGH